MKVRNQTKGRVIRLGKILVFVGAAMTVSNAIQGKWPNLAVGVVLGAIGAFVMWRQNVKEKG